MNEYEDKKEINEAIAAAKETLRLLDKAEAQLSSAGNWGLWDMFGGGLLSTMMKHSKMDDAERTLEDAKRSVLRLQKELKDVNASLNLTVQVDDFLTFADYFFDGLIVDWMVQSKINEAKNQVTEAKYRINQVLTQLNQL